MNDPAPRTGPTVVCIPDVEVSDAMGLAALLDSDERFDVRLGDAFSADEDQVCAWSADAEVLAVGLAPVTRRVLDECPRLRLIVKCGIGVEFIDVAAAAERGVQVLRTVGANVVGVAEYVVAAALHLQRMLPTLSAAAHEGRWREARTRWAGRLPVLHGQRIGLVGFGAIAQHTAAITRGLGMEVVAYDPFVPPEVMAAHQVTPMDLDELMRSCDVVSVHATLTADNHHLLDARRLSQLRPDAVLINAARGGLVDQSAVAQMLVDGRLAGAALDTLEREPPDPDEPILSAPRCLVTPHLAGTTRDGYVQIGEVAARLLSEYIEGRPFAERHLVLP